MDVFFNKHHTYGYKLCSSSRLLTPLFLLHTRVLQKCEKKQAGSLNFTFRYLDDVLWLNCFNFVISHLSNRTWNKGYYSYIYTCFIHLPTRRNWQWWALKSDTLRQKRKFQFSTFHLYVATFQQHLHMEYIYISVDAIFQSLWFLSWLYWYMVAANKEATEPRFILKLSISKLYGRHHDWVDHYDPFCIYDIIGYVNILTGRLPLVEQELYTIPEHLSWPSILSLICMFCRSSFVLLYFFIFWLLCCLSFLDFSDSDFPLVSSNTSKCPHVLLTETAYDGIFRCIHSHWNTSFP